MASTIAAVCVFCGSSMPSDPRYREAAIGLGELLAKRDIELIYGGGSTGLMGTVADAALAHGGRVIGVIPTGLFSSEVGHRGLTKLHEVTSMHERKQLMYSLADAFMALPGGFGTLEELAEAVTWSQIGLHKKSVALIDVDGFWNPLVEQLDKMVAANLLKPKNRKLIQLFSTAEDALEAFGEA